MNQNHAHSAEQNIIQHFLLQCKLYTDERKLQEVTPLLQLPFTISSHKNTITNSFSTNHILQPNKYNTPPITPREHLQLQHHDKYPPRKQVIGGGTHRNISRLRMTFEVKRFLQFVWEKKLAIKKLKGLAKDAFSKWSLCSYIIIRTRLKGMSLGI